MIAISINDMISEHLAAEAKLKSAKSDLEVSKLIAKDGRDGPNRVQESDDVYSCHIEVEQATMRSTKARCALMNQLEVKGLDHDLRVTICNVLRGITAALAVHHG